MQVFGKLIFTLRPRFLLSIAGLPLLPGIVVIALSSVHKVYSYRSWYPDPVARKQILHPKFIARVL